MLATLIATLALAPGTQAATPPPAPKVPRVETIRREVAAHRTVILHTRHAYPGDAAYTLRVDASASIFAELSGRDHVWAYGRGVVIYATEPNNDRWTFKVMNLSGTAHRLVVKLRIVPTIKNS